MIHKQMQQSKCIKHAKTCMYSHFFAMPCNNTHFFIRHSHSPVITNYLTGKSYYCTTSFKSIVYKEQTRNTSLSFTLFLFPTVYIYPYLKYIEKKRNV